ncbi:MAG: transcription elongation factor GreB [Myxococcota bacterium]
MSRYITPEGFQRLQDEAERLWRVERPRVTHEVSEAAALGDRSENAEYIYGKRRLREIDQRLRYLAKRMDELTVVRATPEQQGKVFFGAYVELEEEDGTRRTVRLVGPDESEPAAGRISIESPLGRALLGRSLDDEVLVRRPRGDLTAVILSIRYEEP